MINKKFPIFLVLTELYHLALVYSCILVKNSNSEVFFQERISELYGINMFQLKNPWGNVITVWIKFTQFFFRSHEAAKSTGNWDEAICNFWRSEANSSKSIFWCSFWQQWTFFFMEMFNSKLCNILELDLKMKMLQIYCYIFYVIISSSRIFEPIDRRFLFDWT